MDVPELLLRPEFAPGESVRGYLCRLAHANSVSRELLRFRLDQRGWSRSVTVTILSALEILLPQHACLLRRSFNLAKYALPRNTIDSPILICDECVATRKPIPVAWEFSIEHYPNCAVHGHPMRDVCHDCNVRRPSWRQHWFGKCACRGPIAIRKGIYSGDFDSSVVTQRCASTRRKRVVRPRSRAHRQCFGDVSRSRGTAYIPDLYSELGPQWCGDRNCDHRTATREGRR